MPQHMARTWLPGAQAARMPQPLSACSTIWCLAARQSRARIHAATILLGATDARSCGWVGRDLLVRAPGVTWGDIAGLEEPKRVLQENVILPLLMPDYFQGIRRPVKVGASSSRASAQIQIQLAGACECVRCTTPSTASWKR